MGQDVVWVSVSNDRTTEHLRLDAGPAGFRANGLVVGRFDGLPLRLRYTLDIADDWTVGSLRADLERGAGLDLDSDRRGNWHGTDGMRLETLEGCLDVDIQATPFTNTLPIRRLGLEVGGSREISVVYIPVPSLVPRRAQQKYTRLGPDKYLFEGLETGFRAVLQVDDQGLVLGYTGLFRRV